MNRSRENLVGWPAGIAVRLLIKAAGCQADVKEEVTFRCVG